MILTDPSITEGDVTQGRKSEFWLCALKPILEIMSLWKFLSKEVVPGSDLGEDSFSSPMKGALRPKKREDA